MDALETKQRDEEIIATNHQSTESSPESLATCQMFAVRNIMYMTAGLEHTHVTVR